MVSTAAVQVEMDQRSAEPSYHSLAPPAAVLDEAPGLAPLPQPSGPRAEQRSALRDSSLDEGLAPLPPGLQAKPWSAVRDSSLGGEDCAICLENMAAGSESSGAAAASLVVQFGCKHTFCEICVREFLQISAKKGRGRGGEVAAVCPRCRAVIG